MRYDMAAGREMVVNEVMRVFLETDERGERPVSYFFLLRPLILMLMLIPIREKEARKCYIIQ